MLGAWFALLVAVGFGVFVLVPLSIVVFEPVASMHPRSAAGYFSGFGATVLLVVHMPPDNVLRSVMDIDVSNDTVNDVLSHLFLVF